VNALKRLGICIAISFIAHAILFGVPQFFKQASAKASGGGAPMEIQSENQMAKVKIPEKQRPSQVQKTDKEIAARVTSNDEKLKMNEGAPPSKRSSRQTPGTEKPAPKAAVGSKANVERAKYVEADLSKKQKQADKPKSLKQIIEETAKEKKETIKSSMSRTDYLRFKQSLNVGRMKGVPTPTLAFAYYDLSEILTAHNVFGMKVIVLDPKSPRTVVEVAGISSGSPYCQKIDSFNGRAYSNRIYRRTEPFFTRFMTEAKQLLGKSSAMMISMTPASSDAYFRYKSLEAIKQNGFNQKDVATVIGRFHKTSFNAMILAIEKLHMKDGSVHAIQDFELTKIQQ